MPPKIEAAYNDEDAELDAKLAALGREAASDAMSTLTDAPLKDEPAVEVAPAITSTVLRDHLEDYKPADSHISLEQQVFECKSMGLDSMEATDQVFKAIYGRVPDESYAMYKNIKLYRIGQVAIGQANDRMDVERRMFGTPTK